MQRVCLAGCCRLWVVLADCGSNICSCTAAYRRGGCCCGGWCIHTTVQPLTESSSAAVAAPPAAAVLWLLYCRYCNKGCLQDAIDRGWLRDGTNGPVSLSKVIVTATEIAAGMFTLHKADVVHGDLSPYNVLLSGCVEQW